MFTLIGVTKVESNEKGKFCQFFVPVHFFLNTKFEYLQRMFFALSVSDSRCFWNLLENIAINKSLFGFVQILC